MESRKSFDNRIIPSKLGILFFSDLSIFSEYELVKRLQKSDVRAFDILYHKYQRSLYLNILKLIKDEDASRDILQELFITLWEKRSSLDAGNSVIGWLFVVSYNLSIAYLKKELKRSVLNVAADASAFPEPPAEVADMRSKLVKEAIEKLSPQKRRVFELCKIQGKSYEETARELNISKHTVNEYLVIAVQYIRTYIRQHPEYQSAYFPPFLAAMLLCG
jgi:RNA polymerase sigma factor (sigma-70 family)